MNAKAPAHSKELNRLLKRGQGPTLDFKLTESLAASLIETTRLNTTCDVVKRDVCLAEKGELPAGPI